MLLRARRGQGPLLATADKLRASALTENEKDYTNLRA